MGIKSSSWDALKCLEPGWREVWAAEVGRASRAEPFTSVETDELTWRVGTSPGIASTGTPTFKGFVERKGGRQQGLRRGLGGGQGKTSGVSERRFSGESCLAAQSCGN